MSIEERLGRAIKTSIFNITQLGHIGISQNTIVDIFLAVKDIESDLFSLFSVSVSKENNNQEELFTEISDQINVLVKHFIEQAMKIKNMNKTN